VVAAKRLVIPENVMAAIKHPPEPVAVSMLAPHSARKARDDHLQSFALFLLSICNAKTLPCTLKNLCNGSCVGVNLDPTAEVTGYIASVSGYERGG
jgi:hypothetical protein